MSQRPLVIYHGPVCNDGFAAALCAYQIYGNGADYMPMNYGKERDEFTMQNLEHASLVRDREVYILDFSFKWEQLFEMKQYARAIFMFDHHKTAQDEIAPNIGFQDFKKWKYQNENLSIQFDPDCSGAMQAADYFLASPRPELIVQLGAYDLWKFVEGDNTDAISLAINMYPKKFDVWQEFLDYDKCHTLLNDGKAIMRFMSQRMDELMKHTRSVDYDPAEDHPFPLEIVNAPYFMASRLGNKIAKLASGGCAMIYTITDKRTAICSFRSINGKARQFAQSLGGGGHDNAAGAEISLEKFIQLFHQEKA